MPPAETVSSSIPDGRRERTVSTRRRILDSTRGLILSGDFNPTASAIADHAGITRRTLFRHFPDMETLHREIILDAQRYAQAVMDEPFPSHLKEDLKEDLQEDFSTADRKLGLLQIVIERRVRIYEYLLPLHVSSLYQRYRSSATEQAIGATVRRRRKRLKEILPNQMVADALLFESVDGILSIEFWISLRQDQQLSVARATLVLQYAVTQMISGKQD
ncbi:MAG: TetR/AcrR family transcriptional regulator [Gammaproteobacteria bacterium]|nr:TetR/AcrR family transcriptional regulator [Candidatus Poribacteria bacterium]MCZ6853397.1 TetR/AcrR family transcriptional regulator [Gammaproteobacteria bacterium]